MSDKEDCNKCDSGFTFDSCPMNADREGHTVTKEIMSKYGLCLTLTEEEKDQVTESALLRSSRPIPRMR